MLKPIINLHISSDPSTYLEVGVFLPKRLYYKVLK